MSVVEGSLVTSGDGALSLHKNKSVLYKKISLTTLGYREWSMISPRDVEWRAEDIELLR
jgi:hypothetical protein